MIIVGILFFIFGFVTWLNGSLIPFLKIVCDLSSFEALFVTFAFYISYTVMALPMASILERTGYKNGMALGLFIMSLGALLFIPAALSATYIIFLLALFTLGAGLTLLQTASNPYIVLLGPIESAAMRISIMGLINKSAGVLAPLVFTVLILSDIPSSQGDVDTKLLASQLIKPYIFMAVLLLGLAFFVKFSSLQEVMFEEEVGEMHRSIFSYPRVVLGAVALFFYVGIEVMAGDTIGLYAQSMGIANATAYTSYTMAFMVIAYLIGVFTIPKYLSQQRALIISALLGIVFIVGVVFSEGLYSIMFVALLGFANALVWPTIWPLALQDLGAHTAKGSALLIMAIAGGALLPLLFGKIAQIIGSMQYAYLIGIVCYLIILAYGMKWHKMCRWKS